MLPVTPSHELKAQAAALQSKAEKHSRWGLILANAGEVDLASEHFSRAETEEHTASMLYHAAHTVEEIERERTTRAA